MEKLVFNDVKELEMWLHAAKAAHGKFEEKNGPDDDWQGWYARWIWNTIEDQIFLRSVGE